MKKNVFKNSNLTGFLKEIGYLLRFNWKTLILFVVVFFVFNVVTSYSIYHGTLHLAMKIMGTTYIDGSSAPHFLVNPFVILLLIIGVLLFTMVAVMEVSGIIHIFSMARIGRKTTLKNAILAALNACFKTAHPKNWLVFLYLLVFLPILGIFAVSTNYLEFFVPEFIMTFINSNILLKILWICFMAAAIVFFVLSCFSLPFYFTGTSSHIQSIKKSFQLIKKRVIKTVIVMGVAILLFYIFNIGISAVLANISSGIASLFKSVEESNTIATSISESNVSKVVSLLLFQIITPVLDISVLIALFFEYLDEDESLLQNISKDTFHTKSISKKSIPIIAILLLCVGFYAYSHIYYFDAFVTTPSHAQVIAHRGDSVRAPENTYPAFEIALLEGVDCLELDVQQTKDGVIVVSHDDSLKKFTGENIGVHDVTYKELMEIDVGSCFSEEYKGLKMSTLDEILKLIESKEGATVQIEIKVAEYDHHLEEKLIQVIRDNHMEDRCSIISLSPEPLERVHALDPDMHLVYTMSLAYGDVSAFDFVEGYSIEQSNISVDMVADAHRNGKKVYAWTANSGKSIQYLLDCGVDGILTDDPIMLDTAIERADYRGGLAKIIRILLNILTVS